MTEIKEWHYQFMKSDGSYYTVEVYPPELHSCQKFAHFMGSPCRSPELLYRCVSDVYLKQEEQEKQEKLAHNKTLDIKQTINEVKDILKKLDETFEDRECSNLLSPEDFAKEMRKIKKEYKDDPEACHSSGDCLLCEVLDSLGYTEGIEVFDNMKKW